MQGPLPIVKELLLVGGGHTHALVLRKWGMRPVPGVRVTVVNPGPTAPYSGMLPGHIAGHYAREDLDIDLIRLARFAGARIVLGSADAIDPAARRVRLQGGRWLDYDLLSLDVGITAEMPTLPGFAAHGIAAKPLGRFADQWAEICAARGAIRIAILGGGVAGCEVAMAAIHKMRGLGRPVSVTVIDRGAVLSSVRPAARRRLLAAMARHGVTLVERATPAEVLTDAVLLDDGRRIDADLTIGTAGATPHPWIEASGLPCKDGFLIVDEFLRSPADPAIYAAGDCAHIAHAPRPKAGVYAVRAAPVLTHNLRADLVGEARRPFRPQSDFLKLISLGGQSAVAEKAGFAVSGPALWHWKNRIDQRFMDRFRDLPAMPATTAPKGSATGLATELAGPAPCGGCGAKLGAGALAPIIADVRGAPRDDVARLPGDDAAMLTMGAARQVVTTDHLRAFASDPALVARVAAIHAMGDIWAMGARPQAALATVILPNMAVRLQSAWLAEVMDAASGVFAAEGVAIVGGHSSMGSELTVGFTLTGLLDGPPIMLTGAQAGDALILTKPIGSGAVLAAEMRMLAQGEEVASAWQAMQMPQSEAAAILSPVAHAMTDVTGFGLAGHLGNICAASDVGAEVALDALPLLPGALRLSALGVRSTLWAQNLAALSGRLEVAPGPTGDLILDPQTAGGLLAAIPETAVAPTLAALDAAGYKAAKIGRMTKSRALRFS